MRLLVACHRCCCFFVWHGWKWEGRERGGVKEKGSSGLCPDWQWGKWAGGGGGGSSGLSWQWEDLQQFQQAYKPACDLLNASLFFKWPTALGRLLFSAPCPHSNGYPRRFPEDGSRGGGFVAHTWSVPEDRLASDWGLQKWVLFHAGSRPCALECVGPSPCPLPAGLAGCWEAAEVLDKVSWLPLVVPCLVRPYPGFAFRGLWFWVRPASTLE